MISRKEQWKPEFWLRYAWSVYRHYFGHRKEFIKVRQCFLFWRDQMVYCGRCDMGEQHCCTEGSTEAESSRRVSGGSECSGKYADSVSDVQQMKRLQNRYQNASSDPAGMEELTTKCVR